MNLARGQPLASSNNRSLTRGILRGEDLLLCDGDGDGVDVDVMRDVKIGVVWTLCPQPVPA